MEYALGNTGTLTIEQVKLINELMAKGHSMRKAKRLLGITKKKKWNTKN
jgi:hypothetical protein